MVEALTPGFGGDFFISFVSIGQAAGQAAADINADFAGLTGIHLVALDVQQMHIVQGNRLAHGAKLVVMAVQVADNQGGLGLTKALHDVQAGGILELAVNLGVQGFAGGGGMFDGA